MGMKYKNKKAIRIINREEVKFDSQMEAHRYDYLLLLLKAKRIEKLTLQPKYVIMDGYPRNGRKIRDITYSPDFRYFKDGEEIVEDVKGAKTETYKIKRKLFLKRHGVGIRFLEPVFIRNKWIIEEV
jgi:hypothetical protein